MDFYVLISWFDPFTYQDTTITNTTAEPDDVSNKFLQRLLTSLIVQLVVICR